MLAQTDRRSDIIEAARCPWLCGETIGSDDAARRRDHIPRHCQQADGAARRVRQVRSTRELSA